MVVAIANGVAVLGGVALIAGLLWAAMQGNGERETEQAARDYFTEHGHWPED